MNQKQNKHLKKQFKVSIYIELFQHTKTTTISIKKYFLS